MDFLLKYNFSQININLQTMEQFEYDGCDNCESFLKMKKNKDRVIDCTSNNFDGMIAVMSPEDSWVCKWQRISNVSLFFPKFILLIKVLLFQIGLVKEFMLSQCQENSPIP